MLKHKIKKFFHKNFKISGVFSAHEFDQTDFGRIYFNIPEITEHPKTKEELAATLKQYNKIGRPVKIRNTGHSANGQTLTDGVQINISEIDHVSFNKEKMEVTAGCGASWDKVLKTIGFPKYCLPIFPNNPGQQIHIGGTASVGGVSPYSWNKGGLWNYIKRITLVTMQGEVLSCSAQDNSDYFYYSLGGFGRVGVITEIVVSVVRSNENLFGIVLSTYNLYDYSEVLQIASGDSLLSGVMGGTQLTGIEAISKRGWGENAVFLIYEQPKINLNSIIQHVDALYKREPNFYLKKGLDANSIDVSLKNSNFKKSDLVYWYPNVHNKNQLNLSHAWSDFVIPQSKLEYFSLEMTSLIYKYKMEKYLLRESFFDNRIDFCVTPLYGVKKLSNNLFPLSLDLPNDNRSYFLGCFPRIAAEKVENALAMIKEITELTYNVGGKRYLYGIHNLSKKQVEQHFTSSVINKWQKIKDELDPKHLLNIGVIEHLD